MIGFEAGVGLTSQTGGVAPGAALFQQFQNAGAFGGRFLMPVKAFIPRAQTPHAITAVIALAHPNAGVG